MKDEPFTRRFVSGRCLTQSLLCQKSAAEMEITMKIVMLGAPGAGKGNTGQENCVEIQYSAHFDRRYFRANIKNGTELEEKQKKYNGSGNACSDETDFWI